MRKKVVLLALACGLVLAGAASAQSFSAGLTGGTEIPGPGDADGSGFAVVTFGPGTVSYIIIANNIGAPTMAHIHRGAAGAEGPIVVDFNPAFTGLLASGTVNATQAIIDEIRGNPSGFYVNVHNSEFSAGAIRGQLTSAASALRLNSARPFEVTLSARDQRTGRVGDGLPIPQNDLFGYFSLPTLTANADNPEVFVKLLDGRTVNGSYWVFYGGLTDLEYTITVRDIQTGQTKAYHKDPGTAVGGFDTSAFTF